MKKLRWRIIWILILINIASSGLSELLTTPLEPELLAGVDGWMLTLMRSGLRSIMTLVIFTIFIILGVREITAPVLRLSEAARRIAGGDFDVEIPETRRRDEIGQLEQSFAVMAKELQSTEYIQKDFVSNVSHEYKTPLAVIAGYARLLEAEEVPEEERRQYAQIIGEEAGRLSRMTSNVLLISRLENQGIQPAFSRISLDEQLRQAALFYHSKCAEKGIALEVELDEPVWMDGNAELLMHVWTNLLENAVKFTEKGGAVTLRAERTAEGCVVCVEDTGVGMDAETAAHVFDQFYQGDTSHKTAGNGLGLALARRVVVLHGGGIEVESVEEEVTRFLVRLP